MNNQIHPASARPGSQSLRRCGKRLLALGLCLAVQAAAQQPKPTPRPTPTPKPTLTATPTPAPTPAPGKAAPPAKPSAAEIGEARALLGALGYWVALDLTEPDASLRHALIAFQKIENRPRTGALTPAELQALRAAQRPKALESGYAHIEIDLARQVLFVVDSCGVCLRILPISSGNGEWFTEGGKKRRAITPTGRFKVQRKIAGWRKSPLGSLYYPNYILDGVAIHGNPLVPPLPASHGCIRIPMFAAKEFYDMAALGMPVIVYESGAPPAVVAPLTPCAPAR